MRPYKRKIYFILCLLLPLIFTATMVQAHEAKPTIAEVSLTEENLTVELRLNLESLLTGSNKTHVGGEQASLSPRFVELSRLPGKALELVLQAEIDRVLPMLEIRNQAGEELALKFVSAVVPGAGEQGLGRDSHLSFSVSAGTDSIALQWLFSEHFGTVVLRSKANDKDFTNLISTPFATMLKPAEASAFISMRELHGEVEKTSFINFIVLGFQHILPKGLDHILFVAGLFFLSTKACSVLAQISVFTLAHTITLGLGYTQVFVVPAFIVEPLIALSIVIIGLENLFRRNVSQARLLLVFAFGLLHGLGFASVLNELVLADESLVSTLLAFNVGVELGQMSVIVACYALLGWWQRYSVWYRRLVSIPASLLISAIGFVWFVQRLQFG